MSGLSAGGVHTRSFSAALTEVLLTGGLPPLIDSPCAADDTYRHLFPRVIAQNHKYYKRFPGDIARVQRIVTHLSKQPGGGLRLANGDNLTPRCLLLLRFNPVLVLLLHIRLF